MCRPPMHALGEMFPVPLDEVRRPQHAPAPGPPCLFQSPAKPGVHSHTPSSELWCTAASGIAPGRSESPCPRTITGGGGGGGDEQVVKLGASSAEWRGGRGMEVRLPITPFS